MSLRSLVLLLVLLPEPALCWQQDVDYEIHATLDVDNHTLEGMEVLTYRNNSPDTLNHLWIHLYPNAYKDRGTTYAKEMEGMQQYEFSFSTSEERGHIEIISLFSDGRSLRHSIEGTEMRVKLPQPLKPGGEVSLEMGFLLKVPRIFSRLGHKGEHYEVTQWYPKAVVYDEHGWHPDGYHALGEFYGEYGDYDVWITLPQKMVVGATGVLMEPEEEIERMKRLAAGERFESLKGMKTLHFRAERVHDFAWVADPDYRVVRGREGDTAIWVLYLPEHEKDWKEVLGYAKDALRYYGNWYGEYPYPTLTVADGFLGTGGGMEYPNLVICSQGSVPLMRMLELVVMHEIGHQWFYGLLGSNEMDEAWLDEGINTFSEIRYMEEKYGKKGNLFNWPNWLGFMPSIGDRWVHQLSYYLTATNHAEKPILTPAYEFVDEPIAYQTAAYSKPAWVVDMLRYLLGEETFDRVMRTYVERYSYRHPHFDDFIQTAEEVSGQDLNWFFNQWLKTTEVCDYAIKGFGEMLPGNKREVVVERRGEIVMPVDVMLVTEDGERHLKRWDGRDRLKTLSFDTAKNVKYAVIDPDNRILEVDKWNNRSPREVTFHPIFSFPSFNSYQIFYSPLPGLNSVDGLKVGGFVHGRELVDYQFIKGRHNWELSFSYGLRSKRWFYGLSYRTPLCFEKNRVRMKIRFADSDGESRHELGLSIRLGKKVFFPPEHLISLGFGFSNLWTRDYGDTNDYSLGRVSSGSISYSHRFARRRLEGSNRLSLSSAREVLGGDWSFNRFSLESVQWVRLTKRLKFRLRGFAGYATGGPPAQEQFFLSGGLRPTGLSRLFIGRKGTLSPQERWHIEGDGNLRGYFGRHIRNKVIASLNVEIPLGRIPMTPLRALLFCDVGNCWPDLDSMDPDLLSDLGLSLSLGPLNLTLPLWISHPRPGEKNLGFRWVVGLGQSVGPAISL